MPRPAFDDSVRSYDEMYRSIPIATLARLTAGMDKAEFAGMFEVERRVNELPQLTKCVSVSLFCQKVDNKFPHEYGAIEFSDSASAWHSKYMANLMRLLRDFASDAAFRDWKLRVYLEKQLESLVSVLSEVCERVEIFVMRCDSVGALPGMVWRFLAFDDRALEVAFVTDIDDTLASRKRFIAAFEKSGRALGRYMPHANTGLYVARHDERFLSMTYTPVIGSMIGVRPQVSDICVREVVIDYMTWRRHRAERGIFPNRDFDEDRDTYYNEPIGAHCYGWGAHWFMYGFDENVIRHTVFPHFVRRGEVQTWADYDVNALRKLHPAHPARLDFEFCCEHEGNEFWKCDDEARKWELSGARLGDECKPWMEDAEVALADKWLGKRCRRVLEYGAGGSTVRWARGRDWHVVEHDGDWLRRVGGELRHRGLCCSSALARPLGEPGICYIGEYPEGYLDAWEPYVSAGGQWGGVFDAVLVDGRARLACARLAARRLLAPGGVILWHDFGAEGRLRYEAILAECEIVERVGTMAVLRPVVLPVADVGVVMTVVEPPEKVAWALRHLRAVYPDAPAAVISDGVDNAGYAEVAMRYGADYIRGERLKVIDAGARWWQRAFEAGLALGTRHILKVDPDTRFNRPARYWPEEDCFGYHLGPGMIGEHLQGGVQGFQRSAVGRIVESGICLRDEFKKVAYWTFHEGEGEGFERDGYLSTDRLLMRILNELKMSRTYWTEVVSHWGPAPADAERYAISHAHK